jgi:predicted AlkP superfamily pyrophosphatase or phosphodiesterase
MKPKSKHLLLSLLLVSFCFLGAAQSDKRPKLVVGLVVDQMRWDYLYRYADRYGPDGFKRLLREGFSCENAFIPYTPTYTAAGHSCVYTGSVPSLHGIMGNNWYSKEEGRVVYCTEDAAVQSVGSSSPAGKMSPKHLWSTTLSDELRLAQNFRSKTIAVALKDRGAILPGGHSANAAYWFDATNGHFITSTFYMKTLPGWVAAFNARGLPDTYLKQGWNTLYTKATYRHSTTDSMRFENNIPGIGSTFPYRTDTVRVNKYETFKYLPAGNTFTFEMAKAAIAGERLGLRDSTDLLAISLSSTDYLGHATGPNSVEAEDMYLRLDRDLGQFLIYLDAAVGKGQYLFFLTADHGAAHIPGLLQEHRIPGGALDDVVIQNKLNAGLQKTFGAPGLVSAVINYQVYLNDSQLAHGKLDKTTVKQQVIDTLIRIPGIAKAFDLQNMEAAMLPEPLKTMVINGYNQKLSGDIQFVYKPQWFDGWNRGTTHGVWNPYDSHIPLLWFGGGINAGRTYRTVSMADIAPTLAALLRIQMPNASIGQVIEELVPAK